MSSLESAPKNASLSATDWGWAAAGSLLWTVLLAGISPTFFEGLDFARFCGPVLHLLHDSTLQGQMPWWNPYSSLGRPFAIDMQTATFYPPTYLSVLAGVQAGSALAMTAHGMLAMLGFIGLMKFLAVAPSASRGGALLFLFSAPLLVRMQAGQVPYVFALCYLPLVLWFTARVALVPTWRHWAGLSVAWALQLLCSHPQVSWLTALASGAFLSGLLLGSPWRQSFRTWLHTTVALVTACVVGLALLGFIIVPFVELMKQSDRSIPSLAFSSKFPLVWLHWLSLITGRSALFPINWEYNLHAGLVALIGGVAAITQWRSPAMRGIMVMMGLGLIIAIGDASPVFALLFKVLPGLSNFRMPARAGVLVTLGLIMGATLLAGTTRDRRDARRLLIPLGGFAAAVIYFHYSLRLPAEPQATSWFWSRLAMVLAATAGWHWWLQPASETGGTLHSWRRVFLTAIIGVELIWTAANLKRFSPPKAEFSAESAIMATIQQSDLRDEIAPVRVWAPAALLRENSGMVYHYATLNGFESLSLARVLNYEEQAGNPSTDRVATDGGLHFFSEQLGSSNLSVLVRDGGPATIINERGPRVYVAPQVTMVPDAATATTRMAAGHPFHENALIEKSWIHELPLDSARGSGSAKITRFGLNAVEVEVDSPGRAVLVLAEAWYPGWTASISGQPVPCFPVNAWMRGVWVPEGHSIVQFTYRQNGLLPGSILSILAIATLGWAFNRRPRAANQPAATSQ